jgi:hypothetical protein
MVQFDESVAPEGKRSVCSMDAGRFKRLYEYALARITCTTRLGAANCHAGIHSFPRFS